MFKLLVVLICNVSARRKLESHLFPYYFRFQWVYRRIIKKFIFEQVAQFRAVYLVLIAKDDRYHCIKADILGRI